MSNSDRYIHKELNVPEYGICINCFYYDELTTMCLPNTNELICFECWLDPNNDLKNVDNENYDTDEGQNPKVDSEL